MAQLTDDCFAFSGPLLPLDEMERLIAERVMPVAEIESVPLAQRAGRVLARDVWRRSTCRRSTIPRSTATRCATPILTATARRGSRSSTASPPAARAARALGRGEAIRIFTGAPMPAGADTVFMQEDVRVEAATSSCPPGLKRGANRRLAGEDVQAGAVAACRAPARRAACRACRRARPDRTAGAPARAGRVVLDRRRNRRAGQRAAARRRFTTPTAICSPGCWRGSAPPSPTSAFCVTIRRSLRAPSPTRRADHDLVLTSGGVSTGEADHVRDAVEKHRRAGVLARRHQARPSGGDGRVAGASARNGAAFVGLPGNPVAAFVTFVRVVRPLLLRLAGACRSR